MFAKIQETELGGRFMELGERLLEARKEAGLSQRQVCGDVITRNMLSRIEHGTVRPSMKTLQYLAQVLGKPVGYFLGETTASANDGIMAQARECFADGKYAQVLQKLEAYQEPDPLDWERGLLGFLSCLLAAEAAAAQGRGPVEEKSDSFRRLFQSLSDPCPAFLSGEAPRRPGSLAQPGCGVAAPGQERSGGRKPGSGKKAPGGCGEPRKPLAGPLREPVYGLRESCRGGGAPLKRRPIGLSPTAGRMLPGPGGL